VVRAPVTGDVIPLWGSAVPLERHDRRAMALTQLETALRLYFEGSDYYSTITLSGAADEIFGQLLRAQGQEPRLESIKTSVAAIFKQLRGRPLDPARVAERANFARNALKHWNEGQPLLVEFDAIEEAKDMLERAISNYWALEEKLSPAMTRFQDEITAV
jgi:hypothetical protein